MTPISKNYTAIDSEFAGGGRGPSAGSGLIAVFFYVGRLDGEQPLEVGFFEPWLEG
ncbi:MAG: hypothetical protein KGQ60_04505 [Planctomycetes bacterium]|nr:hypothetical protein [Planctomycetota bacterium]